MCLRGSVFLCIHNLHTTLPMLKIFANNRILTLRCKIRKKYKKCDFFLHLNNILYLCAVIYSRANLFEALVGFKSRIVHGDSADLPIAGADRSVCFLYFRIVLLIFCLFRVPTLLLLYRRFVPLFANIFAPNGDLFRNHQLLCGRFV